MSVFQRSLDSFKPSNIPEFRTLIEEAKYRLGIKHELKRLGVPYDKAMDTEGLLALLHAHATEAKP